MENKWLAAFSVLIAPWFIVFVAYMANPEMGVWVKANPHWATALSTVLFLASAGLAFCVALDPDGLDNRPRHSHGGCNCHGHDRRD
jgi:hypothetical protein